MELTSASESTGVAAKFSAVEIAAAMEIAEAPAITESAVIVTAEIAIAGPVATVETVEPGASADENAAVEVFRAVISVRRACVWVVTVVAIATVGSWTDVRRRGDVGGTDSNADAKPNLGMRGRGRENYEKPEETDIF